jgi:hypothetical protein
MDLLDNNIRPIVLYDFEIKGYSFVRGGLGQDGKSLGSHALLHHQMQEQCAPTDCSCGVFS